LIPEPSYNPKLYELISELNLFSPCLAFLLKNLPFTFGAITVPRNPTLKASIAYYDVALAAKSFHKSYEYPVPPFPSTNPSAIALDRTSLVSC